MRVPASVQTIHFETDSANMDYQGIGIDDDLKKKDEIAQDLLVQLQGIEKVRIATTGTLPGRPTRCARPPSWNPRRPRRG